MKRVAFYTLGCKVNQYDTQAMIKEFEEAHYQIVNFEDEADLYIINTCTVTGQGASKSRKITRRAKRRNPEALIGVVGCYPQVDAKEVLEMDEVDFAVGTKGRKKIVDYAQEARASKGSINFVQDIDCEEVFEDMTVEELKGRARATVKIQEGCDQFCSYCIIPYARGGLRSRDLEGVRAEVSRLAGVGYQEIVLTGIHLGQYGADKKDLNLTELLKKLIYIDGIERIRLSSIEGTEVSGELIDLISQSDKLCRHLHLPLQSGSDKILKAMNRPYNIKEFKEMVYKIRDKVPDIAITTDVIVGFPGESEGDFEDTYKVIKELKFTDGHIFKYSKRKGTRAATFSGQLPSKVKKDRSKRLRSLIDSLSKDYRDKFIGKEVGVLLERSRDRESNLLVGLTDNYLRVFVDGSDELKGEILKVRLFEKEEKFMGKVEYSQNKGG